MVPSRDSNRDSNPGEHLRTSAYRYGKHSSIFDPVCTATDGDVRNDTTFKTVAGRPAPSREGSTPSHSRHMNLPCGSDS